MLQLLFTCKCMIARSSSQIELFQKEVWRNCEHRDIGGFFLRSEDQFVGLFEGQENHVVAQVERLIRKDKVGPVRVVREVSIANREWNTWNTKILTLTDLKLSAEHGFESLAKIVEIAVEAGRRESLPN